jgi:hypothetical protein
MARSEISIDVPKTFAYRRLPVSRSKIAPILRSDRFALGAVASVGRGSGQRAVVVIGAARPGAPFHVTFACSLAAVLWAAFRRAPRAALTRERLAAVDALERLSGLHRDELVDDPHSPILLRAGAASGLLLVVDAIDEKEAPREAHNRECFSTPSRGQLR